MRPGVRMRRIGYRLIGLVLLLAPLAWSPAWADGKDCPLLGKLDNFSAPDAPDWNSYVAYDFAVTQDNQNVHVTKIGKLCHQIYRLKPGVAKLSGLEIMTNYEDALGGIDAKITNTKRDDDGDIYATVTKDGAEYWLMVTESNGDTVTTRVLQVVPFQSTLTAPSGDDYHLLGHLPRTTVGKPTKTNFDEFAFTMQDGNQKQQIKVRGFRFHIFYEYTRPLMSGLESQLNYRAALKNLGARNSV